MPSPGELVSAEQAREALFAAVSPWLAGLAGQLPADADQLRALVLIQTWPTMGRFILVNEKTGTSVEAARASAEDLPNAEAIGAAAEQFLAAGLSAMPATASGGALQHAEKHGAGFVILIDPATRSCRCVFAPRGIAAPRWVELFSIAEEDEKTPTLH